MKLKYLFFYLLLIFTLSCSSTKWIISSPLNIIQNEGKNLHAALAFRQNELGNKVYFWLNSDRFGNVSEGSPISSAYSSLEQALTDIPSGWEFLSKSDYKHLEGNVFDQKLDDYLAIIQQKEHPIGKNIIRWDLFPTLKEKKSKIYVGYGDAWVFTHDRDGNKFQESPELAHGWNSMHNYWIYPKQGDIDTRYYWNTYPDRKQILKGDYSYSGGFSWGKYFANRSNDYIVGCSMFDNENELTQLYDWKKGVIAGTIQYGLYNTPNFIFLDYSDQIIPYFARFSNYYYNGNNVFDSHMANFPFFDKKLISKYNTIDLNKHPFNQSFLESIGSKHFYKKVSGYFSASLPENNMYQLNSDGHPKIDKYGDRVIENKDFEELIRGEKVTFRTVGDRDEFGNLRLYYENGFPAGYYKNGVPVKDQKGYFWTKHEAYWGSGSMFGMFAEYVYSQQAIYKLIYKTPDISKVCGDIAITGAPFIRVETETAEWGSSGYSARPISAYQIDSHFSHALNIYENIFLWSGFGSRKGNDPANSGGIDNVKQGQAYPNSIALPLTFEKHDLSQIENYTAGIYFIERLNELYGFFNNKDVRLVFTEPSDIQDGEILATGRLNSSNGMTYLVLDEPRTMPGEILEVMIGNKKNSTTCMVNVEHRRVSHCLCDFKEPDLSSEDVWIRYVPLKQKDMGTNKPFKLSGNLTKHEVL